MSDTPTNPPAALQATRAPRSGLAPRLLLGPVLIALLVGLMWLDWFIARTPMPASLRLIADADGTGWAGIPLTLAGVLLCGRAGWELSRIFNHVGVKASAKSLTFCAVAGLMAGVLTLGHEAPIKGQGAPAVLATGAGLALFLTMAAYVRDKDLRGAGAAVAAALVAFTHAGLMLGFLMALRRDYEVWVMVAVVMTIKACDIGAYFTGRSIGRNKLIPWLSPGKTWEGLFGGIVLSCLCGVVMALLARTWDGLESLRSFTIVQGVALGDRKSVV